MNRYECDVLKMIRRFPNRNQRELAEITGCSVGSVNQAIRSLIQSGYLDQDGMLTEKAMESFGRSAPKQAVILAAGYGMRMVPINMEYSKALLEVNGEPLIERQIKQLREAGVEKIYVVVGFMKEKFDYLIDEYGVELIVNPLYATKNNLQSLALAKDYLDNCYVVPCDIWCSRNPFDKDELYSWYMVSDLVSNESSVRVNRKMELVKSNPKTGGNAMVGIAYITGEQSTQVRDRLIKYSRDEQYDNAFWEDVLFEKDRMILGTRMVSASDVAEINTLEDLRELDSTSRQLRSDALDVIAKALGVQTKEIVDIRVLKKGMTNRSFLFRCRDEKYIMRIPGEGTDQLINRAEEAAVYRVISGKKLCDDPIYLNPVNGYKATRYIENVRVCDPDDPEDLRRCMDKLRTFHEMKLEVGHEFDLFERIDFYESLWNGQPSVYRDYEKTKRNVLSLRPYIDSHAEKKVLTHIDAVPDNFLFDPNSRGELEVQLTDWEYSGMQDPHVDIAMFCVYAMYKREQVDRLIDLYFREECPSETRLKIYCYIAVCGLLWSNWCEYKRSLGVEFGEYSLRQYRFAKDYYRIFCEEWEEQETER